MREFKSGLIKDCARGPWITCLVTVVRMWISWTLLRLLISTWDSILTIKAIEGNFDDFERIC